MERASLESELQIFLLDLISKLRKQDKAKHFWHPVNGHEVPDYLNIIKSPMDFSTMEQKIHKGDYRDFESFQDHLFLIISNCRLYNAKNTPFVKSASVIELWWTKNHRKISQLAKKLLHPTTVQTSASITANDKTTLMEQQRIMSMKDRNVISATSSDTSDSHSYNDNTSSHFNNRIKSQTPIGVSTGGITDMLSERQANRHLMPQHGTEWSPITNDQMRCHPIGASPFTTSMYSNQNKNTLSRTVTTRSQLTLAEVLSHSSPMEMYRLQVESVGCDNDYVNPCKEVLNRLDGSTKTVPVPPGVSGLGSRLLEEYLVKRNRSNTHESQADTGTSGDNGVPIFSLNSSFNTFINVDNEHQRSAADCSKRPHAINEDIKFERPN